ncbi:cellulase N-terminal Ig-like domain-containing protein [Tunturiibacter empetritectus]|uniref:cellulase N-terminal Ig-like domain-containing protein n=1 Tax=Tunturiibacter empetritectus TaxID=3069691 RepID=UPI003D9B5978
MGQLNVVVDQVGYETRAPKSAIVVGTGRDHPERFSLVDTVSGKAVLTGSLVPNGQVDSWGGRVFWTADFSSWRVVGHYAVQIQSAAGEVRSCSFDIDHDLLERSTLSNVVYYFKGQRRERLDGSG